MAGDDTVKAGIDASGASDGADEFEKAVKKINDALGKLSGASSAAERSANKLKDTVGLAAEAIGRASALTGAGEDSLIRLAEAYNVAAKAAAQLERNTLAQLAATVKAVGQSEFEAKIRGIQRELAERKKLADAKEAASALDAATAAAVDRSEFDAKVRGIQRELAERKKLADAKEAAAALDAATAAAVNRSEFDAKVRGIQRELAERQRLAAFIVQQQDQFTATAKAVERSEFDAKVRGVQRQIEARQELARISAAIDRTEIDRTVDRFNRERALRAASIAQAQQEAAARRQAAANVGFGLGSGSLTARGVFGGISPVESLGTAGNLALGTGLGIAARGIDAGIRTLTEAIDEGRRSAIAFNREIGLINTITKDSNSGTEAWSTALRGLSREFNINEVDVAKGAYQALSNQIIKSAGDTKFLSDALTLAKVTGAGTVESVNALSSVINSFGASAGTSTEIVDQLFKAVDLGNFRLGEVGNSLGRVTSLAAPLGISFKEVLASLETTTIKGVKADEALSALSNLYSELLKPSDALAAALRRLGFATAEQGIATLKYSGLLKALAADARETGVGFEKLFPNIRGLREALLESNDGLELFDANLQKTSESSGAAAKALGDVRAAAGEETLKALNSLKESASEVWTTFLKASDSAFAALRKLDEEEKARAERKRKDRQEGLTEQQAEAREREREAAAEREQEEASKRDAERLLRSTNKSVPVPGLKVPGAFDLPAFDQFGFQVPIVFELKKTEDDLHKERLKKIAELRAKQEEASHIQSANVEASTREFLNNLDRRTAAIRENLAKQRDVGGGDALSTALKLANDEEKKKLIEERIQQLKDIALKDLTTATKLRGKDFIEDKSLEDAKKAADDVVKLRTQQRDEALSRVKPEDRDAALAAITSGKFGSLTGLGAPGGEVARAQEELEQAKREQVEIEQKSLEILQKKGEEARKQEKDAVLFSQRFKDAEKLNVAANLLEKAGVPRFQGDPRTSVQFLEGKLLEQAQGGGLSIDERIQKLKDKLGAGGLFGQALRDVQRQLDDLFKERNSKSSGFISSIKINASGTEEQAARTRDPISAIQENSDTITNLTTAQKDANARLDANTLAITNLTIQLRQTPSAFNFAQAAGAQVGAKAGEAAFALGRVFGFDEGGVVGQTFKRPGPTDNVPALLTVGERVLSVKQNRSFEAIVESALTGKVRGFAQGGPVTHIHGGLNVTVRGGNSSPATAGEIGRALQREIRRGTLRLG